MNETTHTRAGVPGSRKALAIAVSSVVAGTQSAQAQQTTLEEIVVTASKRETGLQELPQQITAFTTSDIERRGFKGIDDYFREIPSLSLGRNEPQGTTIVFRGVISSGLQFGGAATSAIYLDEQPITATGNNPDPRLIDIARVEALSGPQPSLFGDASQSGTLRIITNKPDATAFDGWVDLTGTQVDGGAAGYDVNAMVNVPLVQDRLAVRLVGFSAEEGGYVDNVLTTSPGGTKDNAAFVEDDVNDKTTTGGRAMLRWTPNADWTVDGTAMFQEIDRDGFGDLDVDIGGFDPDDLRQARFNNEEAQDQWYQLGLTTEGKLGWADVVVHGSYFDRELRYTADATTYQFAFQSFYPYYAIYDFNGDPIAYAFVDTNTKRWTVEARLSTPAESDSRWSGLVGFFYNEVESDSLFLSGNDELPTSPAFTYLQYLAYYYGQGLPGPTNNWFFGVYEENVEQFALFGEFGFDLTENVNVTAGGRWFNVENDFSLFQGFLMQGDLPNRGTDGVFTDEFADSDETGFVPRVSIQYSFAPDKMAYFTYSEGFRRGGSNPVRRLSILPGSFDSDELENFEVGAKTQWLDGRLQINAAAWTMTWNDIQVQVSDPQPGIFAFGFVNFPEADINGFEASFAWLPAEGWDIQGSVGYTDAEIAQTVTLFEELGAPLTANEGDQLPLAPEWKTSLSLQYTFPRELLGAQPFVGFDYAHVGDSINSLAGIEAAIFAQGPTPQGAYDIGDFRIGLEGEMWNAQFFIENLWDERAEVFFNNRYIFQRQSINQPRTFGVSVRRRFGGG